MKVVIFSVSLKYAKPFILQSRFRKRRRENGNEKVKNSWLWWEEEILNYELKRVFFSPLSATRAFHFGIQHNFKVFYVFFYEWDYAIKSTAKRNFLSENYRREKFDDEMILMF